MAIIQNPNDREEIRNKYCTVQYDNTQSTGEVLVERIKQII
jgi:hypothetical protein